LKNLQPAEVNVAMTAVSAGTGHEEAISEVESTFTLQAMDEFKNARVSGGATKFRGVATLEVEGGDPIVIEVDIADNADGTYTSAYTLVATGYYTFVVTGDLSGGDGGEDILGSPFILLCDARTSAADTTAEGDGLLADPGATAGELMSVDVVARGAAGPKILGGEAAQFALELKGFGTDDAVQMLDAYQAEACTDADGSGTACTYTEGDQASCEAVLSPSAAAAVAACTAGADAYDVTDETMDAQALCEAAGSCAYDGTAATTCVPTVALPYCIFTPAISYPTLVDNGDGSYKFQYRCRGVSAATQIFIKYADEDIKGSPWTIPVHPAGTDAAESDYMLHSLTADGELDLLDGENQESASTYAGDETVVELQANDEFGTNVEYDWRDDGSGFTGRVQHKTVPLGEPRWRTKNITLDVPSCRCAPDGWMISMI
jgi:hypothetical protein